MLNWKGPTTKLQSSICTASCTYTNYETTDLLNHTIVKNTKTLISWEWNVTFYKTKILHLCLKWHILRSYRFVADATLKDYIWHLTNNDYQHLIMKYRCKNKDTITIHLSIICLFIFFKKFVSHLNCIFLCWTILLSKDKNWSKVAFSACNAGFDWTGRDLWFTTWF